MAYQVYIPKRRGKERIEQPIVSLSKSSIVLNKHARAKLNFDLLELAYDAKKNSIRIRPGTQETGLRLRKTKLVARPFFVQFGITKTGKFVADYDDKENALFVQL